MTLFGYFGGVDKGNAIRLNSIQLSSVADGSVSFGGCLFDDAAGSVTLTGWQPVAVNETACTTAPRLFTGFVADRRYRRSSLAERTGVSREIDVNMVDQNAVLGLRIISHADGKRPAETDIERIDWLLGSSEGLQYLVTDLGLVDRGAPRPQEEADYRGQYAYDVLTDICGPARRLFFVYWDQDDQSLGLFYDYPAAVVHTSTLTISNVLSDISFDATGTITGTCYPPSIDAELTRDPSEVYSRIRFTYANGTVIEDDTTTGSTFFPSPIFRRGLQVENSRVGKEATAQLLADQLLDRDGAEQDTLTCTVQLPASLVGLIDAGMRIGVRFSHLPGYETQVFTRVTRRNIVQADGTNTLYNVSLELSTRGLSSTGGGGAPGTGEFPHPPPAHTGHWWSGVFNVYGENGGGADGEGWSKSNGQHLVGGTNYTIHVDEVQDGNLYADHIWIQTGFPGGGISNPALRVDMTWGVGAGGTYEATFTCPDAAHFDASSIVYVGHTAASGDHSPVFSHGTMTFWVDPEGWDTGDTPNPPQPAQPVPWTVVVMSGADGTTAFPYAAGSLLVKVDGVLISTASYTETDPSCGDFTLSWIPDADEVVTVAMQGA